MAPPCIQSHREEPHGGGEDCGDDGPADLCGGSVYSLAQPANEAEVLAAYPYLEPGDVQAALAYAAWRTQETELPLP